MSPSRPDAAPSLIWIPELGAPGDELSLGPAESRYVSRVCRARAGESLSATDGRGARARLVLIEVGAQVRARLETLDRTVLAREAVVWCGAPEGSRGDWLVEKLAELGVTALQPLDSERATWRIGAERAARWRRLAVAAMCQSRRSHLMRIEPPRRLADLVKANRLASSCWVADPAGSRGEAPAASGVSVGAIGPSQGFAPGERDLLERLGFRPMSLSDGRLRCETAALAWAAWWSSRYS